MGNQIGASGQTFSEQESAAQIRLLTDSAVAIQSQGQPLTLNQMTELVLITIGSNASPAHEQHEQDIKQCATQCTDGYVQSLSKLPPGMAMLIAGVCALIARQGDVLTDGSVEQPKPVVAAIFSPRQLEFLYQSAIILYSVQTFDAYGYLLNLVLESAPECGAVHAALGMLAERRQDHQAAVRCYRSAFKIISDHPKIPLVLTTKPFTLRRLDEARALLDELKPKFSDHPEFWNPNGLIAYEQHRFRDALEYVAKAPELDPGRIHYGNSSSSVLCPERSG